MRKFKTRESYRHTYIYHFSDGTTKTIGVRDGVTLEDIAFLHQLDDEEIDQERRHKHLVPSYLEEFALNDENDQLPTNPLLINEITPPQLIDQYEKRKQKEKLIQALGLAIKKLSPKQQKTVKNIFYKGLNNSQFAKKEKVSETAIRFRLKTIYRKLEKNILKIIGKKDFEFAKFIAYKYKGNLKD